MRIKILRSTRVGAAALAAVITAAANAPAVGEEPGEVNIYSYRQPYLIEPLLKEFTDETGIKTNIIFASKGLI
ncbi:MAG: iron ABC transporter substrate-binding protein, partial [Pseudomonadota bacterium]